MTDEGDLTVEGTGETVGEAKWQALRELERVHPDVDKAQVRFQVVSEGKRGLLGVGYAPARVVATVEEVAAPTAPGESEEAAAARALVRRIADTLGVHCRVDVSESGDSIVVTCSGSELGVLIGKRGRTLDAVQDLVNAVVFSNHHHRRKLVVVDAAGYRGRRETMLVRLAVRHAEQVAATGLAVDLDPMPATERKIIHVGLRDYPGVETVSEGTEPNRYITIKPVGEPLVPPGTPS